MNLYKIYITIKTKRQKWGNGGISKYCGFLITKDTILQGSIVKKTHLVQIINEFNELHNGPYHQHVKTSFR